MRERALDEVATTLSESFDENCDALVDEKQMTEIFGQKYAACPEKFQFLPGEIKLLNVLANHVKNLVDGNGENMGLAQFNDKKKKNKKKNLMLTRIAKSRSQKPTAQRTNQRQSTKQLFNRLLICLNSYGIDVDDWTEHLVEVDSSGSHGSVKCVLCDENQKPKRVFFQDGIRSSFWVFSNFNKHLEKVHSLVANQANNAKPKRMNDDSELMSVQEQQNTPVEDDSSNAIQSMNAHAYSRTLGEVDEERLSNEMNESVQFLSFMPIGAPVHTNNNTNSWLYEQMSVQIQQMVAANLVNSESEENMEFQLKNQPARQISIVKTSPDGNCLFSALAHQMWQNEITSQIHNKKTKELRKTVVEHILDPLHYHLYEKIIVNRLNKKTTVPTSECKMFIRFGLARGKWGGLETLKAVSNKFNVNVVIVNEFGSCNMVKGSDTYNRTLVIAYRMNDASVYDHYDSVGDMDSEGIFSAAEFIINK